jgi:hypothetical protein
MKKILIILIFLVNISFSQTTTWNGVNWTNGNPNSTLNVVINSNYIVGVSPPITVLNCNTLTINPGVTFTVNPTFYIDVWGGNFINNGTVIFKSTTDIVMRNGIIINNNGAGNFIFEDGSALIQLTNTLQTTPVTFQRKTKPVKLNDYTYWSSPIATQSYMQLPPFGNIRVFSYNQTGWVREWGGNMIKGKGYIAHRPIINDPNPQQIYTMNFVGIPNNGNISITSTSDNRKYHLLGNPYPSVLDAMTFISDNSGGGNRVESLFFWTHNTVISSSIPGNWLYNYTADDYAVINRSGSTFMASSPINDSTPNNNTIPSGNIASGQGFFVKMRNTGIRTFNFNNSQKSYLPFSPNTQFFREVREVIPSKKLWLYLSDNEYLHRNMLISYIDGATDEYDDGYEAGIPETTQSSLYSILNEEKLIIQGRENNIDLDEIIPIGFKTFKPGNYFIGIYKKEGFDENSIILYDKFLEKHHNITQSPYKFTTDSGDFNRFEMYYMNDSKILSNTLIYTNNNNLIIDNIYLNIDNIKIYDILGRLIYENNPNKKTIEISNIPNNILLIINIKINGVEKSFKIIK